MFQVVSCNLLLQSPCFAQDDKQVGLVGREHEVCVDKVLKDHLVCIETLDDIWMFDLCKYLLLILSLVNLAVKFFVELNNHLSCLGLGSLFSSFKSWSKLVLDLQIFVFFVASTAVHDAGE